MPEQSGEIPDDASSLYPNDISKKLELPEAMQYTPEEVAIRDRVQAALREGALEAGFPDVRSFIEQDPYGAASSILWDVFLGDRETSNPHRSLVLEAGLAELGGKVVEFKIIPKDE